MIIQSAKRQALPRTTPGPAENFSPFHPMRSHVQKYGSPSLKISVSSTPMTTSQTSIAVYSTKSVIDLTASSSATRLVQMSPAPTATSPKPDSFSGVVDLTSPTSSNELPYAEDAVDGDTTKCESKSVTSPDAVEPVYEDISDTEESKGDKLSSVTTASYEDISEPEDVQPTYEDISDDEDKGKSVASTI